ncbi:MAG: MliC family protein [Nitrosospira multiformis]|nr:MliC family protein [Nitrosospira multiformis]
MAIVIFGCAHFPPANTFTASETAADEKIISYRCESGYDVDVIYRSVTTAIVRYAGKSHEMTIGISASGARYIGGGLEWWTKGTGPGSTGTLFRHESDGTTGKIIQRCEEQR